MGDRYRYARPRSPVLYNPARASLPINVSGYSPMHSEHLHNMSPRREVIPGPRSSTSSIATTGPTTTTTYKIAPESARSSVREGSRTRRSTLENSSRPAVPAIVTAAPRHRPVVHSGSARPASPMTNPYRSSEEEYYAIPGTSHHGHHGHHHHHQKRYSATMDNADMNRLAWEHESSRLRPGSTREVAYTGTRNRNSYSSALVPHRHADTVSEDYGDNGYGYTNPRDLVQYDLNKTAPSRHSSRHDSFDGGRAPRPSSITGYNDIVPRSYDARDRGPPPSTRGFDRLPTRQAPFDWEKPGRITVAPMEPIHRPARVEPIDALKVEPERRASSRTRRPVSLYHERERRPPRVDYYERDDEPRHRERETRERPHRHEQYDDDYDKRGYVARPERQEKVERPERSERSQRERPERSEVIDRPERSERLDRPERPERLDRPEKIERFDRPERSERDRHEKSERVERSDRPERLERLDKPERRENDKPDRREKDEEKHDHKGRDVLATGLSLAGAALGVKAFKDAGKDEDSDDRDQSRRRRDRDYDEEPRRRHDHRDERESIDLGRDSKERRRSHDSEPKPRGPSDESLGISGRDKERREDRESSSRDTKERREDRDSDPERSSRRPHPEINTAAIVKSREDSSASDEATPRSRRPRKESSAAQPFDPKNTMDLKALKDALNAQTPTEPV